MPDKFRTDIRAAFFPAAIDACALYRMFIPCINLFRSLYIFKYGPLDSNQFKGCEVAVVQRQVSEQNWVAMRKIKETGMKIVYDLDDNIWNLPSFNPAKKLFDQHQDGFLKCAAEADVLTVSTKGLASAAKTGFKFGSKDIIIVPNAIDPKLFRKRDLVRNDDKVIIGWGGSNTHSEDVKDAFEVVCRVLDKNPNAIMELVGSYGTETKIERKIEDGKIWTRKVTLPSEITKHPQSRFRRWVAVSEYPNRISCWGWDIALSPLYDNRFNRSKSNIKMLEAAMLEIPCLASDVQPYTEFCALSPELDWLLCRTQNDWFNKLNILINEPERRQYYGKLMKETANKFFNIDVIKNNWQYVFNKALSC